MKIYPLLFISLFLLNCNATDKVEKENPEPTWATRFADAVMHESDSLIYYKRDKPKYEYDFALLAYSINKLGENDKKYSDYARAYIDYFVQEDGFIKAYKLTDYNIDRIRPGLNILELYKSTGEEKYLKASETLVSQMESHPRTKSNGYWHKKAYTWQMWLDGIYMAHPFLTEYASETNNPQWFDEVAFQVKLIYEKTLDKESGLLYHGWDESREQQWCNPETGQSTQFWSRSMGWFVMAIVDILDYFPEDHPERGQLIEILNKTCEALVKVSDEKTGLWYQVLDKGGMEGNYIEGSGSSMFIYTFAKASKKGYLPDRFLKISDEAFDSIIEVLVEVGDNGYPILTNVCGAAGLGGNPYRMGDFDYYINEKRVDNDSKGVGPLILAAIELGK